MGHTQIGRVLAHAKRETGLLKVQALVFVGDAMEEDPDSLAHDAGELGCLGVVPGRVMIERSNVRSVRSRV
jgi:hypothetical protein